MPKVPLWTEKKGVKVPSEHSLPRHLLSLPRLAGKHVHTQSYEDTQTDWTIQPNAGIGIKLGRLRLDYAFTNIGDVTGSQLYSHIFGLILDFEDLKAKNEEPVQ